jgi:hypothetical protein
LSSGVQTMEQKKDIISRNTKSYFCYTYDMYNITQLYKECIIYLPTYSYRLEFFVSLGYSVHNGHTLRTDCEAVRNVLYVDSCSKEAARNIMHTYHYGTNISRSTKYSFCQKRFTCQLSYNKSKHASLEIRNKKKR